LAGFSSIWGDFLGISGLGPGNLGSGPDAGGLGPRGVKILIIFVPWHF